MIRTLVLALALLPATATAAPLACDAEYGVIYTQERVVNLPQDQNKPHLTVIGNPSDPTYRQVCQWFDRHDGLKAFKNQTHFHSLPTSSPMYRDRYAPTKSPSVRFQSADGTVISEVTEIPLSPDALAKSLNRSAFDCLCRPHKAEPEPEPSPPAPVPTPKHRFPWLLLGTLTTAGAGAGIAKQWRDTYYKKS